MTTRTLNIKDLELQVKQMYHKVAVQPEGDFHFELGRTVAERIGYPPNYLDAVPAAAVDSFAGVGYFFDLAGIGAGETVLDVGSGSGTDSVIAAGLCGPGGRVIGVDMTDAQIDKASRLAAERGLEQVEFRKGYIERLPVEDAAVDVVISNGVFNLVSDKTAVFGEVARVLRPGGRLALADIVSKSQLPEAVTCDAACGPPVLGVPCRSTPTRTPSRPPA